MKEYKIIAFDTKTIPNVNSPEILPMLVLVATQTATGWRAYQAMVYRVTEITSFDDPDLQKVAAIGNQMDKKIACALFDHLDPDYYER